jgi:hypothetical protein
MVKRITGRMETISGQVLLVEIMSITGSPGKICYLCSIPHCSKPSEEHTFNVHEIQADGNRLGISEIPSSSDGQDHSRSTMGKNKAKPGRKF